MAASIFLLVPLLSGPVTVHKSRLAMLVSIFRRPGALLTISASGAALHYFLPVLNPVVNVDVTQSPLTVSSSNLTRGGSRNGVFCTANGSSPGRCGKSFDLILSEVTKANQLEVLSKRNFRKKCLLVVKSRFWNSNNH